MKKKDVAVIAIAASAGALVLFGIPLAAWITRVNMANTPTTPTTSATTETTVKATPTVNTDKSTKTYYCKDPLWSLLPTEVRCEESTEEEFLKFTQDVAAAMGFDPDNAVIDQWGVGCFGCPDVQVFRSCDIPREYEYEGDPLFLVSHEYLDGGDMDKDNRRTFFYSKDFKFIVVLNGSYVRSYWGELYTEDYILEIYYKCENLLAEGSKEPEPTHGMPVLPIGEPLMFDVTGDGIEDEVYGDMVGSGMVRTQLRVNDGVTGELYVLDGYNYDYFADRVEDGRLVVIKCGPYGYGDPIVETQGTVVFQNGILIFVADDNKIKEDTAAIFEGADEIALTDDDFVFEYDGHIFSINNDWHDYIDELDYPEEYEENNYGYITTYNGYWWRLQYPSAGNYDWYFAVTLVSPSSVREGNDTAVDCLLLSQTPTARGIKAGDSAESLASLYGAPDRLEYFDNNSDLIWVIYKGKTGEILFAVNNEGIIEYTCLRSI